MDDSLFLEGEELWASIAIEDADNLQFHIVSTLNNIIKEKPLAVFAKHLLTCHEQDSDHLIKNLDRIQSLLLESDIPQIHTDIKLLQTEIISFRKKYNMGVPA